jgi:rubrerythrin
MQANGWRYAVVAALIRITNFKNTDNMKKNNETSENQAAMQYDRLLPAVNDDFDDWIEEDGWIEEDEDYYYQCMVCGKAQKKFNGGSCYLCASPVEKITF